MPQKSSDSDAEIEHVLDSVRRLVSATPEAADQTEPGHAGRFVLTEAHRVYEETGAADDSRTVFGDSGPGERAEEPEAQAQEPEPEAHIARPISPVGAAEDFPLIDTGDEEPGTPRSADEAPAPTDPADQDRLHQMVHEIMCRELQGELGERILRDVRKSVRNEIRNMLEAWKAE